MRLFIAIPLLAQLKKQVQEFQQSLPAGIRKQQPDQMHITLRFLGETSSEKTELLKNKLTDISESSFSLAIGGAGVFPQKGKPKIVWAGIEASEPLIRLQKKVEKVCINAGFKPEKRAFTPHVTLGRIKKASAQDIKEWLKQHKSQQIASLSVNQFVLFESRQEGDGVVHEPIEKYSLPADSYV